MKQILVAFLFFAISLSAQTTLEFSYTEFRLRKKYHPCEKNANLEINKA
jgi:hypothetical protein